jgi:hypothetical protein
MTQKRFSSVDDIPDFMTAAKDFRSDIEQTNSPLSLFDNEAPDLKMARKLVDESINIVGAEVNIFLRTNNDDISEVWEEDADPTYWNPFKIKAFFKPSPIELELKKSGVDVENKMEISLSHRQIYMVCRERMLRAGDVIRIPYNSAQVDLAPRFFRVTNAAPSGNFRYNWLYLSCKLESITADITVRPMKDIIGDIEIIKTNGVYRESL